MLGVGDYACFQRLWFLCISVSQLMGLSRNENVMEFTKLMLGLGISSRVSIFQDKVQFVAA